jgi:hypothetical protein
MSRKKLASEPAEPRIVTIRGQRVILDAGLAAMSGVEARALNPAVKRNAKRFPEDFAFQTTEAEADEARSQIAVASRPPTSLPISSQTVMSLRRGRAYRPWAFTEHGALIAAHVLRSECAVQMSVFVIRAFVRQRTQLSIEAEVFRRLEGIDRKLLNHDEALVALLDLIKSLVAPLKPLPPPPPRPPIGFKP